MASMVEPRTEVGLSDLGNVFIIHFAEQDGYTGKPINDKWIVRAGNHDIVTTNDQSRAEAVARAICGDDRLLTSFATAPVVEAVVEEVVAEEAVEEAPAPKAAKRSQASGTKTTRWRSASLLPLWKLLSPR